MPKVTEEYRNQVRERIIIGARECFIEKGYQRTSMSEVIKRVGLSAGAIYNHFSGKEEIMLAAAQLDLSDFAADQEKLPWESVLDCLTYLEKQPELCRLMLATWGEAATSHEVSEVVSSQLTMIKDSLLHSYQVWAEQNLDFSDDEFEDWLAVIGVAILSVITGFVVQSQSIESFDAASYRNYAAAILTQA